MTDQEKNKKKVLLTVGNCKIKSLPIDELKKAVELEMDDFQSLINDMTSLHLIVLEEGIISLGKQGKICFSCITSGMFDLCKREGSYLN